MKRKIACLLSLTMILSSMSVNAFAAGGTLPGHSTDNGTDVNNGTEADGAAGVNNIDMTQYRIVLPTIAAQGLSYTADPQGLAQLSDDAQKVSDLSGGKVYSNGDVSIANRSSVDVKVTTTVTATEGTATDKVLLGTSAQVAAETGAVTKLALAAVVSEPVFEAPSAGVATDNGLTGYTVTTETSSTKSDKSGYALKADSSVTDAVAYKVSVPVTLKKAEYVAQKKTSGSGYDYAVVKNSVGGAVTISLAGTCTKKGWDSVTAAKMPTVKTKYVFDDVDTANTTFDAGSKIKIDESGFTATDDKVSNLQTSPIILVDVTGATISKTDKKVSFKLFATDSDNTAVKTNWETKAATVQSLTIAGTAKTGATIAVADDGTISVTHNDLANAADKAEVVAKVLYDGKIYTAKVTVPETPAGVAPSVTTTTASIVTDTPIYIHLDLGEGSEIATGVTEISYTNNAGDTTVLSDNYYTFKDEDGNDDPACIRLKPSFLNTLTFTSRIYTVKFDNANETTGTFTLTKS